MTSPTPTQMDWQFWVATAVAALAFAWIVRYVWRIIRPRKVIRTKATLTVGGETLSERRSRTS
jgi:hypothetical protein